MIINLSNLLQGNVCFLGAISQLFLNNGINIKEEVLYGLGFGLNFRYKIGINNEFLNMDCIDMITDYINYNDFFKSISIDVKFESCNNIAEFTEYLLEHIGQSVLVAIDSFYLPYSATFQSKHDSHVVVLINKNNNDFIIQDNYVSAIIPRKQMITVELDDIVKWCDISCSDPEYKYLMWSFIIHKSEYNITKQFIQERILLSTESYLHTEKINKNVYNGKLAFKKLLETFNTFSANNYNSKDMLIKMNEKISANGGLYQTRKLYGKFIRWYGENYCIDANILDLDHLFDELSNKWKVVSTILLKAALKGNTPNWSDIIHRCEENICREESYIKRFLEGDIK